MTQNHDTVPSISSGSRNPNKKRRSYKKFPVSPDEGARVFELVYALERRAEERRERKLRKLLRTKPDEFLNQLARAYCESPDSVTEQRFMEGLDAVYKKSLDARSPRAMVAINALLDGAFGKLKKSRRRESDTTKTK